ncbi:MAG: DEAD/DEAH box helicase [Promethearchaeota archaeon]
MANDVFGQLNPRLSAEIDKQGFHTPTPIQKRSIPRILRGKSVLLIAPTGHGKTEAAFFPLINRLLEESETAQGVQFIWITPLRALNRDILQRLVRIAEELQIRVEVRHGDTPASTRRRQTLKPPQLFIITPETLQAILAGKRIREHLRNVNCVVIDEIHELASSKRGVQLMVGLERLRELTRVPFQRIGLSATIGNPEEIRDFVGGERKVSIIKSPVRKKFQFSLEYCPFSYGDEEKTPLDGPAERIWELVSKHSSTLIFCNERQTAEALALRLARLHHQESGVHHGSLSREARIEAEQRFKAGETPYLVCTSSLELGLDIGTVDLVIQYGSPRQVIRLVQRVGRAGHKLGRRAKGVIITTKFDDVCEGIVVGKNAVDGCLETPPIHYNALDIVAHQLVGLAIEYKNLTYDQATEIIKRASPYRTLEKEKIAQVREYLQKEGLISRDDVILRPRRKSYSYYFENLSVIPDIPHHRVINVATNRPVGRLDTGFAEEYGQTGNILVLRGRPWEVVKQDEESVYVTAIHQTQGRIPRWSGELIPVSKMIAEGVSTLWNQIAQNLDSPEALSYEIIVDNSAKEVQLNTIRKQIHSNFIPDNQTLIIEVGYELIVIHSSFGTRINQTLGRLLAALLTSQLGRDIVFHADQYRILFRFEHGGAYEIADALKEGFQTLHPNHIDELLELILLRSPYFARRFLHVARRFGVISRSASLRSSQLLRIMQYFTGTPIIEEALREFYVDKLDIDQTRVLLEKIQTNEISVTQLYSKKPSPFARQILARFGEFLEPEIPEAYILEQTKNRLLNRKVRLVCLHCGQWSSVRTIKHLDEHPKCKKCASRQIAGVFPTDELLQKAIKRHRAGMKLSPDEKKALRKGRENAEVVLNYGKPALIAMAGRGIGPTVVKRILAGSHERPESEFYRLILESEKQFIRTREWWAESKSDS